MDQQKEGGSEEHERSNCKRVSMEIVKWFVIPLLLVFVTEPMYRQNLTDQSLE